MISFLLFLLLSLLLASSFHLVQPHSEHSMEKILNKSKSMFFGRKKGSEDNVIRDSDSFYDLDDYSLSSSPRAKASQTMGVKAKYVLCKPNSLF